ncbi:MAG: cyclase family protein [Firmicutes bacterium]|nr:cyclase family protein [Bacillota bacterium]
MYTLWENLKLAKAYRWAELSRPVCGDGCGTCETHINFPAHAIPGAEQSGDYTVDDLVFPLCVIDISEKTAADPSCTVTVDDIRAYEAEYGPIPDEAFVALKSMRGDDMPETGSPDTAEEQKKRPSGWSPEALRYIFEERDASAAGQQTGNDGPDDPECLNYMLGKGKLQVCFLGDLDPAAPAGAVILVSYPKIEDAAQLPARVWLITE